MVSTNIVKDQILVIWLLHQAKAASCQVKVNFFIAGELLKKISYDNRVHIDLPTTSGIISGPGVHREN